jgi:ABC-2 type transport system ATP-binding protein
MSPGAVVTARGLRKTYGRLTAVDGIDLDVQRGEIFGLLGPNGAGKTTTILMLLGLTESSGGRVSVCGFDPMREPLEVKRRVGYLPDSVGFYDHLTARENLRYAGRLAGIRGTELDARVDGVLDRVHLADVAGRRVGTFSRGMQQRLGLAEVLLKRSELAILDEPTNGLDPQSTFEFLEMIRGLKSDGVAVLLSSHILDRVQAVCDRVALFDRGRIVLEGGVRELARQVLGGGHTVLVELLPRENAEALLGAIPDVRRVTAEAGGFRVVAERDVRADIARAALAGGCALLRLDMVEPSLEGIYRRYFEREAEGAA